MAKYFAILTNLGAGKLANAAALGTKLEMTHIAVGDGGGVSAPEPTPDPAMTALLGEKRRAAINSLSIDPLNPNQIIVEQVIPETDGGFWIREIGLFDKAGTLIAYSNCAGSYKPQLQEGSGRALVIRMILIVSSTEAVSLKIDPSVVLATRKYVDDKVIEVKTYTDKAIAEHLAAEDAHKQYAKKGKVSPELDSLEKIETALGGKLSERLIAMPDESDVLTYFPGKPTGFYSSGANINNTPEPSAWRDFIWMNHGSNLYGQLICLWEGSKLAVRTLNNGQWDKQWAFLLSDASIVNQTGNSTQKVISQKKVTEELEATSLLKKIKDVDGEGSGLDADVLRGLPATFDSYGSSNGYQLLPSGKIWQWGKAIISPNATVTVPFPMSFPKAVFVVTGNPHSSSYSQSTATINQDSYLKESFSVRNSSQTTQIEFNYMAIGE